MRVVICGGGVIGATLAYYLSLREIETVVVERTGVACAASGKSGGFLARDWCDGGPLESLARRSFGLHAELDCAVPGEWGYRRLDTYGGWADADEDGGATGGGTQLDWLSARVMIGGRLGTADSTAQVHPGQFTNAMMNAAQARGARLHIGQVTDIVCPPGDRARVAVDDATLQADAVVIAMGPWSILAARWLPVPGVYGIEGHSIVFETGQAIPPESVFLEYREASGAVHSPEVFPRSDGTTYVCGISSRGPLPVDPADVKPDPDVIERLAAMCAGISPKLAAARLVAQQACFRPVTDDGLPLIGRIAGHDRVYVATGHSVWGILNAPATGEALAGLLADGQTGGVDLTPFDPSRLPPIDPHRLGSLSR